MYGNDPTPIEQVAAWITIGFPLVLVAVFLLALALTKNGGGKHTDEVRDRRQCRTQCPCCGDIIVVPAGDVEFSNASGSFDAGDSDGGDGGD